MENVASAWVYPVDFYAQWPGVPYHWDVSRAVAEAYAAEEPLRLALYSADREYHSGKYFWSSDADALGRPSLEVVWGNPVFEMGVTPASQLIGTGGTASYTIRVQHGQGFTPTITLQAGPSPSPDLHVDLASPSAFDPPGGQTTLTLTDLHDAAFSAGVQYEIPFTATGGGIIQSASVRLLVNAKQVFLPVLVK
jgi:hypothetical protein